MTQREEFEAWKKVNNALGYGLSRNNAPGSDLDGYQDAYTQGQWLAWQAAQPSQPAQNHVWVVYNKVASMYFWSEDAARKAATFSGSLCMDVSRIDLLDVPAQPSQAHAIDTSPERVEKQAGDVQVPEGWKLVPVEPTNEMNCAGNTYAELTANQPKGMWWWGRVYQAMLSAAPSTKEKTV